MQREEPKGSLHSSDTEKGRLAERLRQVADEVERADSVLVRKFSGQHEIEEQYCDAGIGFRDWGYTGQYQFEVSLSYFRPETFLGDGKGETALFTGNEASVYIYSARYAHTRRTGAALQVVNSILANWDRFDDQAKEQLKREAGEATCNKEDWKLLIDR